MKTFSKPAIGIIALLLVIIAIETFYLIKKEPARTQTSSERPGANTQNGLRFEDEVNKKDSTKKSTRQITYRNAVRCKKAYENIMQSYILTDGQQNKDGKAFQDKPLIGWRMQLDSIRPLLEMYYHYTSSDEQIKELFLAPIMRPEGTDGNPSVKYVSLLITGIKSNSKTGKDSIVFDKSNKKRVFFEYLKPCPDNCPDNIDSIFKDPAYPYPLY